jgi:hypothetical protein
MSASNSLETSILALIFNATPIANLADNAATSPNTQLFVSLHTADPGEAGTQATNETAYTNYARIGVNRNSGGWTVSGNQVSNTASVQFPLCGATPGAAVTHFSIGMAASGATIVLFKGLLAASLTMVANQTQPTFAASQILVTAD